MRSVALFAMLLACRTSAPALLANRNTTPVPLDPPLHPAMCAAAWPPIAAGPFGTISGVVYDLDDHCAPLTGATVVLTGAFAGADTAITDEHGRFAVRLTSARELVTVYYIDATLERSLGTSQVLWIGLHTRAPPDFLTP